MSQKTCLYCNAVTLRVIGGAWDVDGTSVHVYESLLTTVGRFYYFGHSAVAGFGRDGDFSREIRHREVLEASYIYQGYLPADLAKQAVSQGKCVSGWYLETWDFS